MNEKGWDKKKLFEHLDAFDSMNLSYADGKILGSMYTTPAEIGREAEERFHESNLGNPGLCPGTGAMEEELIRMLSGLLNGGEGCGGSIVSGGTEANITALWIARNLHPDRTEVVMPRSAHFSFHKAVDLLGLEGVEVELNPDFTISLEAAADSIGERTCAVVGVAGTTELGVVDDIPKLARLAKNAGAFMHVDAAFGGFVLPFLKKVNLDMQQRIQQGVQQDIQQDTHQGIQQDTHQDIQQDTHQGVHQNIQQDTQRDVPDFDFTVPGVHSITIDPHKMGLSTIGVSALLFRDSSYRERIAVDSPYLTTAKHMSLLGTRRSGPVASAYAAMRSLGREGYAAMVRDCMAITRFAAQEIEAMGLHLVVDPVVNVLGVSLERPADVRAALHELGWCTSVTRFPRALRLVIMPHVSRQRMEEFLSDLQAVASQTGEL